MEFLQFCRRCLVAALVCVVGFTFTACAQIDDLLPFDLPFSSSGQGGALVYVPMPVIPLADYYEGRQIIRKPSVKIPELGEDYFAEGNVTVNVGNVSRGYFKVRHVTDVNALVQITNYSSGLSDFFNLEGNNEWEVFPLTRGDGVYTIRILEYYGDRVFSVVFSLDVDVSLENQNYPFLYPSRYVRFDENSAAVALASRLAGQASNDLEAAWLIYNFITTNISFDFEFEYAVTSGVVLEHTPDIDATLASGRGICFDYAVLAAAMLRSQNIPTRLEIGYVHGIFHAWVAAYIPGVDWGNAAHPSGGGWGLLDPTTTSANNALGFLNPIINVNEYSILFVR